LADQKPALQKSHFCFDHVKKIKSNLRYSRLLPFRVSRAVPFSAALPKAHTSKVAAVASHW